MKKSELTVYKVMIGVIYVALATLVVLAFILQKMEMLFFEIGSNKLELKSGSYGGITEEEMIMILEGNQAELKVWKYIAELIEKSNKN